MHANGEGAADVAALCGELFGERLDSFDIRRIGANSEGASAGRGIDDLV